MELLLPLVIFIVVAGVVYWIATQFLPHPVPLIILVVIVLIMLVWLVGHVGSLDLGGGGGGHK